MTLHVLDRSSVDLLANEVLSRLEIEESRLLNWGFVNSWSDLPSRLPGWLAELPEPSQTLWGQAQAAGLGPADVLANLEERQLVLKRGALGYRSRFAETVRLLFLLRQRFREDDWQTAPRLVSDLRIHLQRRRYPRRDPAVTAELLQRLDDPMVGLRRRDAVRALLTDPQGRLLDLSRFQLEAVVQQFRNLRERNDRGLVIGAGTGAGKTKAFYIPALAELAATIMPDQHALGVIAIYPRVELLKDQFVEAYGEARRLDALLRARGARPITLGTYYGDTLYSAGSLLGQRPQWEATPSGSGWICPYLLCPRCRQKSLAWRRDDVKQEVDANTQAQFGRHTRLVCQNAKCQAEVPAGVLVLARDHLAVQPPDLLFTTTEMLNRRLSRTAEHAVFGIGTATPPRMLLLDEIHTYEGITGAGVGYLIRRWRHLRGYHPEAALSITGLSATLVEAEAFFARLTALPDYAVSYVYPRDVDLDQEGLEYNVVLKGDPVSSTSLLSTSVQSVMLLGRMLDSRRQGARRMISRGAYGPKVFAFTDKLDVTNRWFHTEQDAETRQRLARWRLPPPSASPAALERRYEQGQVWAMSTAIGHDLASPLRIGITSSQSRGVDAAAELVIATSTLEVGFNDLEVGAVVQHKAPRSMASFLQRKGRAGRTRAMRPWMLVVTSAYGRDRWAFQHAENLFDPLLRRVDLPLDNYYVRQVQATFALMDWLGLALKAQGATADVWDALSSDPKHQNGWYSQARRKIAAILRDVLSGRRRDELKAFLRRALALPDDEQAIAPLLWGQPRSLLMEVIPTVLRQLETNWQRTEGGQVLAWSDGISPNPLPDFVPPNLFSDLNLPELVVRLPSDSSKPAASGGADERLESMELFLGMREFAPGNVTKRFARVNRVGEAHWLPLPDEAQLSRNRLPLQHLPIECDRAAAPVPIDGQLYPVYRPRVYHADVVPPNVLPTSSGRLVWRSFFRPLSAALVGAADPAEGTGAMLPGMPVTLSEGSAWSALFTSVRAYTQANGAWAEVTRLAVGVEVDTRFKGGPEGLRRLLTFEADGAAAALGFTLMVDALHFTLAQPDTAAILASPAWPALYRHLGPEYFAHVLRRDVRLEEAGLSSFELDWLWQLELSMLVVVAVVRGCGLEEAAAEVGANRATYATRTLEAIFQSLQSDLDGDPEQHGRLHDRLLRRLAEPAVVAALNDAVQVLWAPQHAGLRPWLEQVYAASVGSVLYAAVVRLVPDIEPDDLILDVEGSNLWLSEAAAGGVGVARAVAEAIALKPREFDLQMQDVVAHCDREHLAVQLRAVAALVEIPGSGLPQAFAAVRAPADLPQKAGTRLHLARVLEDHGISATRELIVALNAKFLRPNSGPDSDALLAALASHWDAAEARIGSTIDLRVMAVAALRIEEVRQQVEATLRRIGGTVPDEPQLFNLLQSLLWLRCVDSCPDCIEHWHPFQRLERPSRALLRTLLAPASPPVIFGAPGWEAELARQLTERYAVQLRCEQAELVGAKQHVLEMLTTPVDFGYQHFHPAVERISRTGRQWAIDLVIHELTQR